MAKTGAMKWVRINETWYNHGLPLYLALERIASDDGYLTSIAPSMPLSR
jgi:hypothetical protein